MYLWSTEEGGGGEGSGSNDGCIIQLVLKQPVGTPHQSEALVKYNFELQNVCASTLFEFYNS